MRQTAQRSRLVANQLNTANEGGLFAATLPLGCCQQRSQKKKPQVLMFNDVSRAYMHARTASDIYVELCDEDKTDPGDEHPCGEAHKGDVRNSGGSARLGVRSDEKIEDIGFLAGKSVSMRSLESRKRIQRDGAWRRFRPEWLCKSLRKRFERKMKMTGEDAELTKEARVLKIMWHPREKGHLRS